jgi:hypothetical protein
MPAATCRSRSRRSLEPAPAPSACRPRRRRTHRWVEPPTRRAFASSSGINSPWGDVRSVVRRSWPFGEPASCTARARRVDTARLGRGVRSSSHAALTAHGWRPRRTACDRGVSARNSRFWEGASRRIVASKPWLRSRPWAPGTAPVPAAWCPAQAGVGCPPGQSPHHDLRPTLSTAGETQATDRGSVVPGASRGGMPSGTASSSRPSSNALYCS